MVIELHIDYEVIRRICMQLIISFRKITLDQQRCHKVHYQLWRVESFGKVNEGEVHQQFSLSFVIFICFPMPMLVTKKVIIMRERVLCFKIYEAKIMILVNAVLIFVNSIYCVWQFNQTTLMSWKKSVGNFNHSIHKSCVCKTVKTEWKWRGLKSVRRRVLEEKKRCLAASRVKLSPVQWNGWSNWLS